MAIAECGQAQTDKRVALIIGNAAYLHTRALQNPNNDAEALAKLLQEKGFAVTHKSDLDYRAMRDAVRAFGQAARDVDIALVYYGGHGLEVAGQNYLIPIDAKLERESDLEYEVIALSSVLSAVAGAQRLRLVILDACRNNPLGERMQLADGVTRSVTRGLARIEPQRNVLVAYAAKEGTVARDGSGRHSPYAEALLKHMAAPGLDVRLMFGKVRDAVLTATRNEQEPFTYGSLSGEVVPLVPGAPLTKEQDLELAFWSSVKDSRTPAVLRTYLERYPDGEFAPIAQALIDTYESQLKAELAAREQAKRRQEEERRAAEVKRIEEERKAREAALAEERRRAEEATNAAGAKVVEERQRAEWLAQTEALKKAVEEARLAREAAKTAEEQRQAAVKAAEEARKSAEQTIAAKLEAEKTMSPAKLAALPTIEAAPAETHGFSGSWAIQWSVVSGCKSPRAGGRYFLQAANGVLSGRNAGGTVSGKVSDKGSVQWSFASPVDGVSMRCTGTFRGGEGSGGCTRVNGHCQQRFTAKRL
jgi:uncharacterized caspase-like protein